MLSSFIGICLLFSINLSPTAPVFDGPHKALEYEQARYHQIALSGDWPSLALETVLHPGETLVQVPEIRQRLLLESPYFIHSASSSDVYDSALVQDVRTFQKNRGLQPDGVIGSATLAALNVSAAQRARQIGINLERLRWSPPRQERQGVRVNIPDFKMELVDHGEVILSMRAIVGKKNRRTPLLQSQITYLEFNPTWNIPQKLLRRDVLPKILKDPQYLESHDIRVFETWSPGAPQLDPQTVAWDSIPSWDMAFKLQQQPGPKNPLGQVKFMFSNPFSVYLHDTPGREKFFQSQRCFSSGCVRLEDPLALATALANLSGPSHLTAATLQILIDSGQNGKVLLPVAVPVNLEYQTAWIDGLGVLQFRDDVYGYDEALAQDLDLLEQLNDSPGAEGTCVEVDEILARIVAHTAGPQIEGGLKKLVVSDSGQAQIDGLTRQMEALASHTVTILAQTGVGFGGTESGNDFNGVGERKLATESVQLVEQDPVYGVGLSGAMVPQNPVEDP